MRFGPATGRGKQAADRPSLDRLIPSLGYTKTNTKIICTRCNIIKNGGSLQDHQNIVDWLTRELSGDTSYSCGDGI
jgi:hypothetical protein